VEKKRGEEVFLGTPLLPWYENTTDRDRESLLRGELKPTFA